MNAIIRCGNCPGASSANGGPELCDDPARCDDAIKFVTDWKQLHTPSEPVAADENVDDLVQRMFIAVTTMQDRRGVGLAAPQIGVNKRVAIAIAGNFYKAYINPVITRRGRDTEIDAEGCLSTYGHIMHMERARIVTVEYESWPDRGKRRDVLTGYEARVMQHEIDHLDGKMIADAL